MGSDLVFQDERCTEKENGSSDNENKECGDWEAPPGRAAGEPGFN